MWKSLLCCLRILTHVTVIQKVGQCDSLQCAMFKTTSPTPRQQHRGDNPCFTLQYLTWLSEAHERVAVCLEGAETAVADVKVFTQFALVARTGDGTHVTRVTPATTTTTSSARKDSLRKSTSCLTQGLVTKYILSCSTFCHILNQSVNC